MREKYVKLIVTLQEKRGFVKGSELAQKLHVSGRTIRSYIRDLNENYLIDAKIKNNKSKGYILTGEIKEIKRTQQIEFEERAFFIIKYLMEKEGWVTYEEIAEDLLFSSQTIRNDVLKIQQLINDQFRDIRVESIIFQGIQLVGSEIDKRLFLDSLSNPPTLTNTNFAKSLSYYFKDWTTPEELTGYIVYLEKQVEQLRIPVSNENLLPIISYLVICLKRIEQAYVIEDAAELLTKYDITTSKEYSISRKLLNEIAKQRKIIIPESEVIYFSFYLMSQRLLFAATEDQELHIPEEIRQNIIAILLQLEKEYHMDFSSDSQLSSGLILHLSRDIYPLLFNFYIENSFITTIKQEYIQAYYISVSFSHLISKKLKINIPENEIGYLAVHFASFIERKNKVVIHAAIVSGRNKSVSVLLKKNLEQKISGLQIDAILSFSEAAACSSKLQLLISPINLKEVSAIPTIQVSELATDNDIQRLKQVVNKLLSKKQLKINYFGRSTLKEKTAVLHFLLQEMGLMDLYESLLEREQLSTTEVGNGVAIPHPLNPSNQNQTSIGVLILEKPIFWGSEEVRLIFLVIPGKDKQAEMSQLMEELHRIVTSPEVLNQIIDSHTKEELDRALDVQGL